MISYCTKNSKGTQRFTKHFVFFVILRATLWNSDRVIFIRDSFCTKHTKDAQGCAEFLCALCGSP